MKVIQIRQVKIQKKDETIVKYRATIEDQWEKVTIERESPFEKFQVGEEVSLKVTSPQKTLKEVKKKGD